MTKSSRAPRQTYNDTMQTATDEFFNQQNLDGVSPREIEAMLIAATNVAIMDSNTHAPKAEHYSQIQRLVFSQIARVLIERHHVVRIAPSGKNTERDYDMLAIYIDSGEDEGIFVTSEDQIRQIARLYDRQLTVNMAREVIMVLREEAPRVYRCDDPDLVPVDNGLFNYRTKELHPFTPEQVFLSKARVPYDPMATSPQIDNGDQTYWEVEEWMNTLSDDSEIVELLWQILGAIVRPGVQWNKSAWFFSEQGNNGKGTLCALMRNLTGSASYASVAIADFGKDFMLEPLTRASAIIVDENDVGGYIDRAANLKAVITGDVIMINRKHKAPISYQFKGFMVQCLNEFPRIKDRSESFYRRQLFVPFTKTFTGRENRAIKNDYLARPAVLRYVLRRVLELTDDYWVLSEPAATQQVLDEYKEFNDPVRSFWEEVEDQFVWDLLPFGFLYDLYKAWFSRTNPSGSPVGRNAFITDLLSILNKSTTWYCSDKRAKIRSAARMLTPEPLIAQFQLKDWENANYRGADPLGKCIPHPQAPNYRGIQRYTSISGGAVQDDDDTSGTEPAERGDQS